MNVQIKHNEGADNDVISAEIRGKKTSVMLYNKQKGFLKRKATDIFWKYKGFGLPVDVVEKTATVYGGKTQVITTAPDNKSSFVATLDEWREKSVKVNFGYGSQYILPMSQQRKIVH